MVLSLFIFGLTRGWKMLQIRKLTCHSTDLPEAFNGYRIVQLTDLHLGTFGNRQEYIQSIVEETNRLHPDLIVFTGDLINNNSQEMLPYMQTLSKLEARDGIYSILGNHDYGEYGNDHSYEYRKRTLTQLIRQQEQMG
jgi:predicted MPP superfamily phosphohydrolase